MTANISSIVDWPVTRQFVIMYRILGIDLQTYEWSNDATGNSGNKFRGREGSKLAGALRWLYRLLAATILVVILTINVFFAALNMLTKREQLTMSKICLWISMICMHVTSTFCFLQVYTRQKAYRQLLDDLDRAAATTKSESADKPTSQQLGGSQWAARIRLALVCALTINVVGFITYMCLLYGFSGEYRKSNSFSEFVGLTSEGDGDEEERRASREMYFWLLSVGQLLSDFYGIPATAFADLFYIATCNMLWTMFSSIADCRNRAPEVGRVEKKMIDSAYPWLAPPHGPKPRRGPPIRLMLDQHKRLSAVVRSVNRVLSPVIFTSTATLVVQILFLMKVFTDDISHVTNDIFGLTYFLAVASISYVWKIIAAARLNDMIVSSLKITPNLDQLGPYDEDLNEDHKHYTLYLTERTLNQTAMTYGGLSPIKKSFLFTIGSVMLTYYLIIKEL